MFRHCVFVRKCCHLDTGDKVNMGGPSRVTLTAKEAATYLGISYWLILELVKRGELNCVKAGGRKLFRQSGLDDWMTRQEAGAARDERPALRRAK